MILFQNILLLKEFLVLNGCFGLFTKIIKRFGTCFCCTFSAWFFYRDVLYLILHLWARSYLYSFSRYQTKCVTEVLFRQMMTSETLRFIFSQPLKQWPADRKRGKDRNTKNWISWEWRELCRWNLEIYVKQLTIIGYCHQFGIRKDQLKKTWIVQKTFFSKWQLGIIFFFTVASWEVWQ